MTNISALSFLATNIFLPKILWPWLESCCCFWCCYCCCRWGYCCGCHPCCCWCCCCFPCCHCWCCNPCCCCWCDPCCCHPCCCCCCWPFLKAGAVFCLEVKKNRRQTKWFSAQWSLLVEKLAQKIRKMTTVGRNWVRLGASCQFLCLVCCWNTFSSFCIKSGLEKYQAGTMII